MTNAHSFPLLRLPCFAKEHVIMVSDVREQYLFSTLSKKSKRIAKNGVRRLPYLFWLKMFPSAIHFKIGEEFEYWKNELFEINILPIGENEDNSDHSINAINLKVEDIEEQSINILIFLNDVFNISTFALKCLRIPNDFVKQFLACVRNLKIDIEELMIQTEYDRNQNEMYEWMMNNCRDVKKLKNYCSTTPDFEWDSEEPFNNERCFFLRSPFLTLDHVTRLFWRCRNFETVDICDKMTNEDLNQLVKLWMDGSSKLEFIVICMNDDFDIERVLRDITKTRVKRARIANNRQWFNPGEAFKIKDKNGKEAVVCHVYEVEFCLTTHFNERNCDFFSDWEDESDGEIGGNEEEVEYYGEGEGDDEEEGEDDEEEEEDDEEEEEDDEEEEEDHEEDYEADDEDGGALSDN